MGILSQNVDYEYPLQIRNLTELDISGFARLNPR